MIRTPREPAQNRKLLMPDKKRLTLSAALMAHPDGAALLVQCLEEELYQRLCRITSSSHSGGTLTFSSGTAFNYKKLPEEIDFSA